MNCSDARFSLAADPGSASPEVAVHLEGCAPCAAYARDMRLLDARLRAAMTVPAPHAPWPAAKEGVVARRPARRFIPRLALAASVAGVALLVGLLWVGVPGESIAAGVVAHMAHEPDATNGTTVVPAADLDGLLAGSGVRLREDRGPEVTYANRCWFRGRHVPHLVVQTPAGPVTVMVLPHLKVAGRQSFAEDGYHGVLVPAERGSIALLSPDAKAVELAVGRTVAAVEYLE